MVFFVEFLKTSGLFDRWVEDCPPTSPVTIGTAVLLLAGATLGASFIPAYRASIVNPVDAVRFE